MTTREQEDQKVVEVLLENGGRKDDKKVGSAAGGTATAPRLGDLGHRAIGSLKPVRAFT